uniref:Endoplasmic reticulum junction formation protein lunapark n=1 Tax=Caenorhabditis japonica TaxID=281687 RepID=A0A8R1DGJ3_CAEJA
MMGNIFSRNKSPATELERVALTIEDLKKRLQTISSSNSNTLYYYYMSIIVVMSIAMAHTWLRFEDPTKSYVACALVVGATIVVLAGRYAINGIYSWRANRTTQKLENALTQKVVLLDLVKETLKFKEAKEILDRFEKNDQQEQEKLIAKEAGLIQQSAQKAPLDKTVPGSPQQDVKKTPVTPAEPRINLKTAMATQGQSPFNQRHPTATPARPYLRQTTALDRVLDYFMSDGPNCRNALICSICHTHNGMALPAEYPYIAFRCFECGHLNPPKKGPPVPLTRPPVGPKGIQHNGRTGLPINGNNANPTNNNQQNSPGGKKEQQAAEIERKLVEIDEKPKKEDNSSEQT